MMATRDIQTARLRLSPVSGADLQELVAFKADPMIYALMLGGVRNAVQVRAELAEDLAFWAVHGAGMWAVRGLDGGPLLGLVGLHQRTDGYGIALRFAFRPEVRGSGLAREAAGAALRYAHDRAGVVRVVAIARESNIGSRTVLGAIGMRVCGSFTRAGEPMLQYESVATPADAEG